METGCGASRFFPTTLTRAVGLPTGFLSGRAGRPAAEPSTGPLPASQVESRRGEGGGQGHPPGKKMLLWPGASRGKKMRTREGACVTPNVRSKDSRLDVTYARRTSEGTDGRNSALGRFQSANRSLWEKAIPLRSKVVLECDFTTTMATWKDSTD